MIRRLCRAAESDFRVTSDPLAVIVAELERFVGGLDRKRFYGSHSAAQEAWRRRGQFNVVLLESDARS